MFANLASSLGTERFRGITQSIDLLTQGQNFARRHPSGIGHLLLSGDNMGRQRVAIL